MASRFFKQGVFFLGLFAFVLLVSFPVLSLDMMYAEQPLLYVANAKLQGWSGLFNVYLHPKILDIFCIPFFRPSGHFLIYQVLTPFFGWDNTRLFIGVNLLFLSLTGYFLFKLYSLLFPGYKAGGYLAFALYLMHPALMLSRLITLHFEFAYVFFVVLSLYCFALFCKKAEPDFRFKSFKLFFASLAFYGIAVTFKEPALMLGPLLALYLLVRADNPKNFFKNRQVWEIFFTLGLTSLALVFYLLLAWPSFSHPLTEPMSKQEKFATIQEFLNIILSLPHYFNSQKFLYGPELAWRKLVYPKAINVALWGLWGVFFALMGGLAVRQARLPKELKKGCIFVGLAAFIFILLPVHWAMALPWHLSLTLLFLFMLLGFSFEYALSLLIDNKKRLQRLVSLTALVFGLSAILVNQVNIQAFLAGNGLALSVARNAIFHPPAIQDKLNAESLIVVENSLFGSGYLLGAGNYTFLDMQENFDYDAFQRTESSSFIQYQPFYNGNLFKWAYHQPNLNEEIAPFRVEAMQTIPGQILHDWLQHYDNIFCLGYDKQGNWQDKTALFKKNLKAEQQRRLLLVHQYEPVAAMVLSGEVLYNKRLSFPNYQLCQYECDQNVQCKGFTYENRDYHYHSKISCQFYGSLSRKEERFCATCIGFIKERGLK